MATKTEKKPAVEASPEDAEAAAALHRVQTRAAIDLADLALLTGVHYSTLRRQADAGDLPVDAARIGQRWVIPSAPVRKMLCLEEVSRASGRNPFTKTA